MVLFQMLPSINPAFSLLEASFIALQTHQTKLLLSSVVDRSDAIFCSKIFQREFKSRYVPRCGSVREFAILFCHVFLRFRA